MIPLRFPLRPRPPLPAKSRPLLRAKSFLPRKSHELPSAATIGCLGCDGKDINGPHWPQRAEPAAEGGTGQRCEKARPIAGRGARSFVRAVLGKSALPPPPGGAAPALSVVAGSRPDTPQPADLSMEIFETERPLCTSHRQQISYDTQTPDTHTCSPKALSPDL